MQMAEDKDVVSIIPNAKQTAKELHWAELRELLSFCESYCTDPSLQNVLERLHKLWIQIAQGD